MGGIPRMEMGSNLRSFSSVATESGCGSAVLTVRYFVATGATSTGVMLNSFPMAEASFEHLQPLHPVLRQLILLCFAMNSAIKARPVLENTPQRQWESFHCEVVRGRSYGAQWHFHP